MTNAIHVNIQAFKDCTKENPKIKALFEMYGKRVRARQDSTVPRMRRVLKDSGIDMTTKELSDFYRLAQQAGAGRCVSGRRGKVSRFLWGVDLKTLADQVNGYKFVLDNKNLKYYLDNKGERRVDFANSNYVVAPLTTDDALKAPPRPRRKSGKPRGRPAAPRPLAAVPKPEVVPPAPMSVVTDRKIKVRKAGFEIEFPLDMTESDWKDAAVFLNNLAAVG